MNPETPSAWSNPMVTNCRNSLKASPQPQGKPFKANSDGATYTIPHSQVYFFLFLVFGCDRMFLWMWRSLRWMRSCCCWLASYPSQGGLPQYVTMRNSENTFINNEHNHDASRSGQLRQSCPPAFCLAQQDSDICRFGTTYISRLHQILAPITYLDCTKYSRAITTPWAPPP